MKKIFWILLISICLLAIILIIYLIFFRQSLGKHDNKTDTDSYSSELIVDNPKIRFLLPVDDRLNYFNEEQNEFYYYDIATKTSQPLSKLIFPNVQQIIWADGGDSALIQTKNCFNDCKNINSAISSDKIPEGRDAWWYFNFTDQKGRMLNPTISFPIIKNNMVIYYDSKDNSIRKSNLDNNLNNIILQSEKNYPLQWVKDENLLLIRQEQEENSNLLIFDLKTGKAIRTIAGGFSGKISPQGSYIYYQKYDFEDNTINIESIKTDDFSQTITQETSWEKLVWENDDELIVGANTTEGEKILRYKISTSTYLGIYVFNNFINAHNIVINGDTMFFIGIDGIYAIKKSNS